MATEGTATTNVVLSSQDGGAILAMWLPCVLFAHLFAFSFLVKMGSMLYPAEYAKAKRLLLGRGKERGGTAPTAAAIAAASRRHDGTGSRDVDTPGQNRDQGVTGGRRAETPYYDCEMGNAEGPLHGTPESPPSSTGSVELINKLTALVHPMLMEWEDIGCCYNTSVGLKVVLQGVWGRAVPGDMVALMGPSGAGKSTLMDILAGRKSVGNLTGQVLVNKHKRNNEQFRKLTAYVPQDDNFLPTMTVSETCNFYATMLLPRTTNKAQRHERIAEVLAAMGLSHTVNTLVGGTLPGGMPLRGLSGGERKRLAIAQGIMSTPCIVFLDEPTSGLDSYAALSVMAYLRGMATAGSQTVISSIHQPRAAIWALYDKIVLLSLGRMMFSGACEDMVPWFVNHCGYPYDPKKHGLASDWVMDLVNVGFTKHESLFGKMINSVEELDSAADAYTEQYLKMNKPNMVASSPVDASEPPRDQDAFADGADVMEAGGKQSSKAGGKAHTDGPPEHASATWLTQCRVLLGREILSVTRNPADIAGRCLIFTWLAIFVGLIFYNLPASLDSTRSRLNVLFVAPVILLLMPFVYMSLFTADKQYFIQDVSAKLYRPSAYYVAKQLAVLPFSILNSLLFAYTLYGLVGLRPKASSIGMNGIMSVLVYLGAAQVLTLTAVLMPNQDLAFMIAIAWTAINLLMANFMYRYRDMTQVWLSQLRYLSSLGFAFDGYAQAEFTGVSYSCANGLSPYMGQFLPAFLPNTPQLRSPAALARFNRPGQECVVHLENILAYFNLYRPFWMTCVILVGYLGVLHVATYVGLLMLTKKERR